MLHYLAPLEGLTTTLYRSLHHAHFAPMDKYLSPFLTPNEKDGIGRRDRRELKESEALPLVPQLLANKAASFLAGVSCLRDLDFEEVNLNLGCPSGTVVSKGRGSGFLANPDELRRFFDLVFAQSPLPISVKTRIGLNDADEFPSLMEVFNDFPISELMIHPRLRRDMYRNTPNMQVFEGTLSSATMPICYSGDLFTPEQIRDFSARYPQVKAVLLGRGLLANPALSELARGTAPWSPHRLADFHWALYEAYKELLSGPTPVLHKMKELWYYMLGLYPDAAQLAKPLRKAKTLAEFERAAQDIFRQHSPDPSRGFQP